MGVCGGNKPTQESMRDRSFRDGEQPCMLSEYFCQSVDLHGFIIGVMFVELGIGVEESVPPGECRTVVTHKIHVVEVMESSSSVEWNQMEGVQWNIITTKKKN